MVSNNYVGFFDTFIDDIHCRVFYPIENEKEFATKRQDLRKSRSSAITYLYAKYWLVVFLSKFCRIFKFPAVIKFYDKWRYQSVWHKNVFRYSPRNQSIPYEIDSCLTGCSPFEGGPEQLRNEKTPDQKLLKQMLQNKKGKLIIYHVGVGCSVETSYTVFCQRLAKETDSIIVCPSFSCGTLLHYFNRKINQLVEYSFHIPMYTNSQERKDQNDIRSSETYRITNVLSELGGGAQNMKINAVGHSFGGCSVFHLLADTRASTTFNRIVSLGGSLGVGLTDQDWQTILKLNYTTKTLQIFEDMYLKDLRQCSIFTRPTLADERRCNKSNLPYSERKQFGYTIKNCNHCDIFDYNSQNKKNIRWLDRMQMKLVKMYNENNVDSFENQVFVVTSFLSGVDLRCLDKNHFVEGVPKFDEIDINKVEASITRLLK